MSHHRRRLVVDIDPEDADAIAELVERAALRPSRSEVVRLALKRGLALLAASPAPGQGPRIPTSKSQ